jgi:hypothetical protein
MGEAKGISAVTLLPFPDPILRDFPKLVDHGGYRHTSAPASSYNCIAWAAHDNQEWWWPSEDEDRTYWPAQAPREETLEAFTKAFALLGFRLCEDALHEATVEKVAFFVDGDGTPTHAARQLPNGRWTSKLGHGVDIEHDLIGLEGEIYGVVGAIMKRPAPHPSKSSKAVSAGHKRMLQSLPNRKRRSSR